MLVQSVTRHDVAVAGNDVHRVFNVHALDLQMRGVCHHSIEITDAPLPRVQKMCERILHCAAAKVSAAAEFISSDARQKQLAVAMGLNLVTF